MWILYWQRYPYVSSSLFFLDLAIFLLLFFYSSTGFSCLLRFYQKRSNMPFLRPRRTLEGYMVRLYTVNFNWSMNETGFNWAFRFCCNSTRISFHRSFFLYASTLPFPFVLRHHEVRSRGHFLTRATYFFSALYASCMAGNLVEQLWNFAWPSSIAMIHPSLLPVAVMGFFTKVAIL